MNGIRVVRYLGVGWVWFRVRYAAARKLGRLQRVCAARPWPASSHPRNKVRWFEPSVTPGGMAVAEADDILQGRFRLFSHHVVEAGTLPDWHRNQLTGETAPADAHWSTLGNFGFGDIKGVWELSRFPWAFALGRAYARTKDNRYAERFWLLLEDWMAKNPPNRGPNWMCGQEATFRLMAAVFGADACADAEASTPLRRAAIEDFIAVTGERIAGNLDYALSQSNNHGISECVGLITCALRRADLPEASGWRARGFAALQRQVADLVYPDGAFAQHSVNYHRVLLHDLLWLLHALTCQGEAAPGWLVAAARRALEFMTTLTNPASGEVPLYGANDGAHVLPLSDTDYLDFRPVIHAGYAVIEGRRLLPSGPWDEAADWLMNRATSRSEGGGALTTARFGAAHAHFPDGGCLLRRSEATRVFLRCPIRFKHRPSQADMLHVDIEWANQRIAHDAGSFSYNTAGQFAGSFKSARVHNALTLDGEEPLQKVGRFLFVPWPQGEVADNDGEFAATHDAWRSRGASHRRSVKLTGNTVVICDRVQAHRQTACIHWLLADCDHRLDIDARMLVLHTARGPYEVRWQVDAADVTIVRAAADSEEGWWSPYYHHAQPALSLTIAFEVDGEAKAVTTFAPQSP